VMKNPKAGAFKLKVISLFLDLNRWSVQAAEACWCLCVVDWKSFGQGGFQQCLWNTRLTHQQWPCEILPEAGPMGARLRTRVARGRC
jgi:hypothetical protein